MSWESALAFVAALTVWVLMPGPSNIMIVGRALSGGFRSTLSLINGMLLGDLFYMSLVFFGLAALGMVLGEFFIVVRVLAAFYLIYLGISLWRKKPGSPQAPGRTSGTGRDFLAGFRLTLSNPKAILFHLGFLPTFFDLPALTLLDAVIIMALFTAILGTAFLLYAYAASRTGAVFNIPSRMRLVNRVSGTLLIGAGATVLTRGT